MNPRAADLSDRRPKAAEWITHRERGSLWLLRVMAFLSLHCGRKASRIILYGIAGYFFLFGPGARRHSLRYLRLALGRAPTARDRFRQILSFATTIHDRVYLINEQFEKFNISIEGEDRILTRERQGRGALLLGAHMGSFEVMHSLSRRQQGLRVAMAMYEENARKIGAILAAINPKWIPDIISLGHIDAMLNIAERLDQGAYVGRARRPHSRRRAGAGCYLSRATGICADRADARGRHIALPGVFHGRSVPRQEQLSCRFRTGGRFFGNDRQPRTRGARCD